MVIKNKKGDGDGASDSCSFCGRNTNQVDRLIAGPPDIFICNECVEVCSTLLRDQGKRFALPHARIMIHQPMGGTQGQATDIEIQAKELLRLKNELNRILAAKTGQPYEKVVRDCERDHYMSAEEACAYGLIDRVVAKPNA